MTDPSYCGQILVQTFPMIGNYGLIPSDFESQKSYLKAYIVREWCHDPSNFRCEGTIDTFLKEQGVVGLCGIDTRKLTRILRENGTMRGCIAQTEEEARNIAAEALGKNPEQLTLASDGGEALPSYGFATSQADGDYYIEVTHQGGEVSSFFRGKPEGETVLTQEEAVQQAKEYVERQGFDPLQVTYWISYGNTVTVNFAAVQDNILLYPDLVKVEVSQTDGTIVGVECAGYLANHRSRTLPSVQVSKQAARNALVPALSVQSVRLTLIPTRGEYEVLCYEFLCQTPEGTHCMIYVNAETGEEEKILLLLEDENGTLAQ